MSLETECTVVDVDAHYQESFDNILEYMDEPWRSRFEGSGWDEKGVKQNLTSYFPASTGDRQMYGNIEREHSSYPDEPASPEEIPPAMEALDIDIQMQISHLLLAAGGVRADDQRTLQFTDAYVKYMMEEVIDPDLGIYGLLPLPYTDVDHSLEMLELTEDYDGFVAACLLAGGANPPLGNRKYDRIYKRCEELGLPVIIHTGGAGLEGYSGYTTFIETHTLGFLSTNQEQLTNIVIQGVPEKYPDLDIVFMESGVTYVPALMARLDEEYLKRVEEVPFLQKKPSEYLKEIYYGTQPLEISVEPEFLERCIRMIGVDQIMYASDYPHWDYDSPSTVTRLPFLTDDEKKRILGGNALEVFDF